MDLGMRGEDEQFWLKHEISWGFSHEKCWCRKGYMVKLHSQDLGWRLREEDGYIWCDAKHQIGFGILETGLLFGYFTLKCGLLSARAQLECLRIDKTNSRGHRTKAPDTRCHPLLRPFRQVHGWHARAVGEARASSISEPEAEKSELPGRFVDHFMSLRYGGFHKWGYSQIDGL